MQRLTLLLVMGLCVSLTTPAWAYKPFTHKELVWKSVEQMDADRIYWQWEGDDLRASRLKAAVDFYVLHRQWLEKGVQDADNLQVWRQEPLLISLNHGY